MAATRTRSLIKRTVDAALRPAGLELRPSPQRHRVATAPVLLPLFDDPREALHHGRGGDAVAFLCPVEELRAPNGFSFSLRGWHPMVAALEEYEGGGVQDYRTSVLREYYQAWQPRTALDAIAGFRAVEANALSTYPSHLFFLLPWVSHGQARMDRRIRMWHERDAVEHGASTPVSIEVDGFVHHGPVSDALGSLEFQRLVRVFDAIRRDGFDRSRGHVTCQIVRRGSEFRFLLAGAGFHRAIAASALGMRHVPARFATNQPDELDVDDVDFWPQVIRGAWSRKDALRYVDHLFDFDVRTWAASGALQGSVGTRWDVRRRPD